MSRVRADWEASGEIHESLLLGIVDGVVENMHADVFVISVRGQDAAGIWCCVVVLGKMRDA